MTKRLKQRLSAYISPKELVKIRNAFATTVGITCAICEWNADNEEELKPEYLHRLTKQSGYCRFCNIIRGKKKGLKRCRENEFQLVKWVLTNAHESTRPAYRCDECHAGLIDMAVPIFIGREIRGFFIGGQRRTGKLTNERKNKLFNLAGEIDVDGKKLIEAYESMKPEKKEQIKHVASLMSFVARHISDYALQAKRFAVVSKSAAAITSSMEQSEIYKVILKSALEIAGCERATLWEYDEEKCQLCNPQRKFPKYVSKSQINKLEKKRAFGEGLAGVVAKTRERQTINNIDEEKGPLATARPFLGDMKSECGVPVIKDGALLGVLTVKSKLVGKWPEAVTRCLDILAEIAAMAISNARAMRTQQRLLDTAILAIVEALDRRDPRNAEHSRRVTQFMEDISEKILKRKKWKDFGTEYVRRSRYTGLLHDVGKVGMPDDVLRGKKNLSPEDRAYRKIHPHTSVAIVERIEGLDREIVSAISEHHERYDGEGGYLHKIQGDEISYLGRILSAADAYDSMKRSRGSWRGFSKLAAYAHLHRLKGSKLDPVVVEAFLETKEFREIRKLLKERENHNKDSAVLFNFPDTTDPRSKFLSESYACLVLHHEIGKGILGREDGRVKGSDKEAEEKEWWWCNQEGKFGTDEPRSIIRKSINQTRPSLELSERAREAELAFLHIRWSDDSKVSKEVYGAINEQAFKQKVMPVAMKKGVGILVPHCSPAEAYDFAEEFHETISRQCKEISEKQSENEPVIGVAYVPNKNIIQCKCIIGCAMVASEYALKRAKKPKAIVFFERLQLESV